MSDALSGAVSGASAGSVFGPVGAVVGGILGGAFGGSAGKKRRRAEAVRFKKNTKQAYTIGGDTYASLRNKQLTAEQTYAVNNASDLARLGASGRRLTEGERTRITGSNASTRDSTLEQISIEEDSFRNSTAYEFLQKDYDYMSQANISNARNPNSRVDNDYIRTFSVRTEGRTGESFYTDEQKDMLRSYESHTQNVSGRGSNDSGVEFREYMAAVTPTMDEFFQGRYGNDKDKAAYEDTVTARITAANTVYDEAALERDLRDSRGRGNAIHFRNQS